MRVVVTGGAGFIGRPLCRVLVTEGHSVLVLSRDPLAAERSLGAGIQVMGWDPRGGEWQQELAGADAVVNLAGEPIAAKRWSKQQKAALRDSRLETTRALVHSLSQAEPRPRVLVSASAVGYYGPRDEEPVTEGSPPGADFLAEVCLDWEREALAAEPLGLRVVLVRTGIVLGRQGGALERLLPPFKLFAGGPLASGRQGFPWVHLDDLVGIYCWALMNDGVAGPLNAVAPQTLNNREFSAALGKALGRPSWAPLPGFALKLLLGELAEPLLIQGQKVLPARTEQLGYRFKFGRVEVALRDLLD